MQFQIDKNTPLTLNKLGEILMRFNTGDRMKLDKYYRYYRGEQDILSKKVPDPTKPCNRIVTNYCSDIVGNYQGYLTGHDIAYSSDLDISEIQDILNYNDVSSADNELLKQALIYGRAFEIVYIDEDGKQRFKVLDSRECIPIYDNTLNQELLYVIRYYQIDTMDKSKGFMVEIYSKDDVAYYRSDMAYSAIQEVERIPHAYKQVPITVFSLNQEEVSIFDKIITLQDAYNTLLSSEVDDFQAFCDAYLVLKGCNAEPEDIESMKYNRVLILDADAGAEYLNKNISDTQIENMLTNIDKQIHKISNSPDFADEAFGTSSGVAMKYKLLGFENQAGAIEKNMIKALQKRIELLCSILQLTEATGEATWRDIEITFTRNLPIDLAESASIVNSLRGLVSDKTLLTQLPFVADPEREAELLQEQNALNASLYGFPTQEEEEPKAGEE